MRLRLLALTIVAAAVLWAMPRTACAQPIEGVYVGANAGVRLPLSTRVTPLTPGFGGRFELEQRAGYDARLSIGYAFGNGWRLEMEGNLGRSGVRGVSGLGSPATATGAVRTRGIMANALFDLDISSPYIYPYLGLGIGYQSTRVDRLAVARAVPPASLSASGDAGGIAVQAIVGLSFPVPYVPGLSVTAGYRVMDIPGGLKFGGTTKFHSQFIQTVSLGVRYAFNTPVPAAAVPAAPTPEAQTQNYTVLFDLNGATLTARGEMVVREAAQGAIKGQMTRIEIGGHADTSGGARANQALSERRAKAIAAALVGQGVPKESIAIQAYGDTRPLVETGSGVKEPRNRRVEIVNR